MPEQKKLAKNDFIEIDFIGSLKNGGVFDTNLPEELKKLNPNYNKDQAKPFIFALGQDMFLKGIDEFLIGKNLGDYTIELTPEQAFGKRNPRLIQLMPISVFQKQNLNPQPGVAFNFDGKMGKVLTSSGGRITVDFNNPLAGKDVVYKIKVKRKIENLEDKAKALMDFLFRMQLPFEIKEKTISIKAKKEIRNFVEMFKDKFKEILGLDLKVEEPKEEKPKEQNEKSGEKPKFEEGENAKTQKK